MYESYIESQGLNRYQKKLIKLPFPRFVVFYNGEEEIEEDLYMRLSDAFELKDEDEKPAVECIAKFVNINYGHNQELMEKCKRLNDYAYFVQCVRAYLKQGCGQKEAVVRATDECIDKGFLRDILVKHRAEVVDMFLTTFDKKMYKEAILEEGIEKGREEMAEEVEKANAIAANERQRADEEKQRADKAELEVTRLREEITRLKVEK